MANTWYPKAREAALSGGLALDSSNVRVILVDLADYTYSASHDFLDDVPSGARVAVSGNLASKTITDGVFDAADVTFSAVTGDQSEALIVYVHTGTESTSRLLLFMDTGVTGLPVTPAGVDINVAWNASGIAAI